MPDVRVKKNMNREHVRNSSRQNRANITASQNAGTFLPELNDLSSREEARSPISSPKKLNMQTKIRSKNAPLVNTKNNDVDSTVTPPKTFGLLNLKRQNIDNPRRNNYTN